MRYEMKKNTIKKRKIHRDCWGLDWAFLFWLKERLPVYLKDAGKFVDLDYHKFEYKGKTYTQREIVERMIHILDMLPDNDWQEEWDIYTNEILDLWKIVFPAMWW